MKIEEQKLQYQYETKRFEDLAIGEVFIADDVLCMRICPVDPFDSISLEDGTPKCIGYADVVMSVDSKLIYKLKLKGELNEGRLC